MTTTFLIDKQGSRLSLRSPAGKRRNHPLRCSPRFFLSPPQEVRMEVNPLYKDVPGIQIKIKELKRCIKSDRATIVKWEAAEPSYPLLPYVKEQLKRELKDLKEITDEEPCQQPG